MLGNAQASRGDGKCHRNYTADGPTCRTQARVKRCGKSAPGPGANRDAGKPHPEQGQIGGYAPVRRSSGGPRRIPGSAARTLRQRRAQIDDRRPVHGVQNPAYRPSWSSRPRSLWRGLIAKQQRLQSHMRDDAGRGLLEPHVPAEVVVRGDVGLVTRENSSVFPSAVESGAQERDHRLPRQRRGRLAVSAGHRLV